MNSHSSNCNDVVTGCNNVLSEQSLWHSRLGHVSDEILKLFANKNSLHLTSHSSKDCMVCPLSKFRRLSFISNNHYSESPFDLIHVDTWGPYQHATHDGKHYFLTIVDDSSRFTWLYLMKNKSEATQLIKNFFVFVKTNFDKPIKQLRSDNAKELKLDDFLSEQGTLHQFSCPYRPEQNSVVERKHQHLLNVARSLLFQSKAPIRFWGECINTAIFLINRVPTPALKGCSPYEILYKKTTTI